MPCPSDVYLCPAIGLILLVKLNFITQVQIGARACTCDILQDPILVSVGTRESRRLTLPAAKLHLCQGFSSDQWSWKRSRVGAHAVEFTDQWVTSEPVSILTLCYAVAYAQLSRRNRQGMVFTSSDDGI